MYENQASDRSNELRQQIGGAAPKVASPTLSRIFELREDQSITQKLIKELEERLSDILCPTSPASGETGQAASLPPSPLCEEIQRRTDSQRELNARLSALINRITV